MLKFEKYNAEEEGRILPLSKNLFHEALSLNPQSKERFHIKTDKGEDFDLVYWDNDLDLELRAAYPKYIKPPYMANYLVYDEYDKDSLYLDFFEGLKVTMIEQLDEYTIALAKVVLTFTDMDVYCPDERLLWFVDESPRIHIVEELPENRFDDDCFFIQIESRTGMEDLKFNRLCSLYAFHNIFFPQWILNGRKFSDFKYMTFPTDNSGGIGNVLSFYKRYLQVSSYFGLKFAAPEKDHLGKFPMEMVKRYFTADIWNEDANEDNTIRVPSMVIFIKTKFAQMIPSLVDKSLIAPSFKEEMDDYYDAIFGGKKTLGVLIRGSDYISAGLSGTRKMATVEQMSPGIHRWMEEYGYEKIFLATEDPDILAAMKKEFGEKMAALSQERISVSDLKAGQIISEYEKQNAGEDYDQKLEDTTVNYFYALYFLSRCDAFMCSGQCNGWDTVLALNEDKFERSYKYAVGINGDPRTEGWKEIRPVTAGMFARGAYPTEKQFFMTFRFDLKEKVDPSALKEAWEKTTKVYPYVTYATVVRDSKLTLAEDPLPFVFKETGEVIEPSTPEANFHTTTICYLGKTLFMYIDHVPFDGTGVMRVFETLFYHYFCIVDGCEYAVPEGIHTEKDGAVEGLDIDGYLQAEPVDPKLAMGGLAGGPTFAAPENSKEGVFVPKADCRGFCLSVPSKALIDYAKSVKGSPMSVMYVCAAKAMQKVHPENTLPFSFMVPVSIRKVMGNTESLLHQVVHFRYSISPEDLSGKTDEELNTVFRMALKGFSSEEGIRKVAGVYRSICEGYTKAFRFGALTKILMDQRKKMPPVTEVSYMGTLRTGEYGDRIRMTAAHAMQEKGFMFQFAEVGDHFYIDWYQGFHGEDYVLAMRDVLTEDGINGITVERVE